MAQIKYANREALLDQAAKHISQGKVDFFRAAGITAVLGERNGSWFEDAFDNKRWFNCHCNGGVFNLGHRNPVLVDALRRALDHVDAGNHHLISIYRTALAERLAQTTGNRLPGVVFAVGGGEAIDLALKLARGATGRQRIVSACGGYHGHTGLALAAGDPQYREPFAHRLPDFVQVPHNDLTAMEQVVDQQTAAVILETIPATLGMPIPTPGYLPAVEKLCRKQGALLIMDEVQTGLGRTGKMWCFEHDGLQPDMVVTGKGLGGGLYPIAATLISNELKIFLDQRPFHHISTFGGAELGCVVALAVLDLVEANGFFDRVNALSERFGEAFAALPFALRRRGLMMGLAFPAEGAGMMAAKLFYDAGIFCVYANNDTSVLQFLPPLTLTDPQSDELIRRVKGIFS